MRAGLSVNHKVGSINNPFRALLFPVITSDFFREKYKGCPLNQCQVIATNCESDSKPESNFTGLAYKNESNRPQ